MSDSFNLFSGLVDMNGESIMVGDRVRKYDYVLQEKRKSKEYLEGVVVFACGAYRICIKLDYTGKVYAPEHSMLGLSQNYTLLFDQLLATQNLEVIKKV